MTVHHPAAQRSFLPRVLIATDDPHAALGLEDLLSAEGFAVLGPTPTAATSLDLLEEQKPDLAVLDLRLGASQTAHVAGALQSRGIPFVVTIANRDAASTEEFQKTPYSDATSFSWPAPAQQLVECLNRLFHEKTLSLIRAI